MNLLDDIPEGTLVGLDTAAWIYEVEANPTFGPIIQPFFRDRLALGKNRAGSSLMALGELLVRPLTVGRADLVAEYRKYFGGSGNFAVWDVTREVVEKAAEMRAKHRLKMIDAIHVASAIVNRADAFVCNDLGLRRVTEVRVLVLGDYVGTSSP